MEDDLKIYNEGGFDIEIEAVYEENGHLKVETRCPFGRDKLTMSKEKKFLDKKTGKPQWRRQVKKLLEKKYGRHIGANQTDAGRKDIHSEYLGKANIEDLEN